MTRLAILAERARNTFWVLPALGILLAVIAGITLPRLDPSIAIPDPLGFTAAPDTARTTLQVIVTMAVSVAGISFSVIVVALVLAAQQLSPRVLRSFQRHPINQAVLGVFLGTATFSLYVLSAVEDDRKQPVPELSITVAMLLAAVSLGLFVIFLHHMVRSLNAAAVIRRITADGHKAVDSPYPCGAGNEPDDPAAAERAAEEAMARWRPADVRAPRAGYVASFDALDVMALAEHADAFVQQEVAIGRFVVSGGLLAKVWCRDEKREDVVAGVMRAFVLNEERIVDDDVAFPLRQLADVALKGLSPSINDPTTAENAMDSVADTLARMARQAQPTALRLSDSGPPRLRAKVLGFDDLVRAGFDQVRRDGANRPSFSVRLLELLADIRSAGGDVAARSPELDRQAKLVCEAAAAAAPLDDDTRLIEETYARLHDQGDATPRSRVRSGATA